MASEARRTGSSTRDKPSARQDTRTFAVHGRRADVGIIGQRQQLRGGQGAEQAPVVFDYADQIPIGTMTLSDSRAHDQGRFAWVRQHRLRVDVVCRGLSRRLVRVRHLDWGQQGIRRRWRATR